MNVYQRKYFDHVFTLNLDDISIQILTVIFACRPSVGRQDAWGSRPFNDHDWGASEPCKSIIIKRLFDSFKQLRNQAGFDDEGSGQSSCNDFESSCPGLDFEATSPYRDEFLSPSSSSTNNAEIDEPLSSRIDLHVAELDKHNSERANELFPNRAVRRRQTTFAKHRRMSLFASARNPAYNLPKHRKSLFAQEPFPTTTQNLLLESAPDFFSNPTSVISESFSENLGDNKKPPLENEEVLELIFDFLEEHELFVIASLVSTKWSDVATQSHAKLMLASVANCNEEKLDGDDNTRSSRRSWNYLTTSFPWACFLSEGAFKRVYKVFNSTCQAEEAISVM